MAVNSHTSDFIRELRVSGRYSFTVEEAVHFTGKSFENVRKDIDRLRVKGLVRNIRKGFYIIIPEEYQNMGIIPAEFFIDDLMRWLNRPYYVGLFSAAMFYGAAHQQPQEFYVVSGHPRTRNIETERLELSFFERRIFPEVGVELLNTSSGYFNISSRELTFLDLIYFESALGGLSRIVTVISELAEGIRLAAMRQVVLNSFPAPVFQRAGYLAEHVLNNPKLASVFENRLNRVDYQFAGLKANASKVGERDLKWKLFINKEIQGDL